MAEADRPAADQVPAQSNAVEGETPAQSGTASAPSETARQPTKHLAQQEVTEKQPSPPLPPRPLAAPHHIGGKNQPLPPPLVQYAALPPPLPTQQVQAPEEVQRPRYPAWDRAKLVLGSMSLLVSLIILGIAITYGLHTAQWDSGDVGSADILMGTSGAPAGLAIVITTAEFWKTALSRRREGMHPGALIGLHLITWLMAAVALAIAAVYVNDGDFYVYDDDTAVLSVYQQVLLAFDCVLLVIHFTVFVGACVETNRLERSKSRVIVVRVPVPVDPSFPGAAQYYPYYAPSGSFVPPPPGTQPGQHQVPMMVQVPQQGKGGAARPAVPQPVTMYGGYYAPAPPGMAWGGAQQQQQQQQQGNPALFQGYYAPAPAPARTPSNSARPSQRELSAPTGASGSRYRRSQRQTQASGPAAAAPAPQQEAQQSGPSQPQQPVSETA